jgi:hypothetical protein
MNDRAQIGKKVSDPEIPKLGLAKGGDAGAKKPLAHGSMEDLGSRIVSILARKQLPGERDQLA